MNKSERSQGEVKQIQHTCMCWCIHTQTHTQSIWGKTPLCHDTGPVCCTQTSHFQCEQEHGHRHTALLTSDCFFILLTGRIYLLAWFSPCESLSLLSCNCWLSNQSEEAVNVKTLSCMRPHLVLSVIIEIRVSGFNILAFKLSWLFSWIPGALLRWGLDLTGCLISMAIYQNPVMHSAQGGAHQRSTSQFKEGRGLVFVLR